MGSISIDEMVRAAGSPPPSTEAPLCPLPLGGRKAEVSQSHKIAGLSS